MGYRHYLYKIDKKIVKDIQGKSFDELWDKYTPKKEKLFQEMMMEKYGKEEKYLNIDILNKKKFLNLVNYIGMILLKEFMQQGNLCLKMKKFKNTLQIINHI